MVEDNLWAPLLVVLTSTAATLLFFWAWSKYSSKPKRGKGIKQSAEDSGDVRRSTR